MQDKERNREEDNGKALAQECMIRDLRPCRETHDLILQLRLGMQPLMVEADKNELYQDKDNY